MGAFTSTRDPRVGPREPVAVSERRALLRHLHQKGLPGPPGGLTERPRPGRQARSGGRPRVRRRGCPGRTVAARRGRRARAAGGRRRRADHRKGTSPRPTRTPSRPPAAARDRPEHPGSDRPDRPGRPGSDPQKDRRRAVSHDRVSCSRVSGPKTPGHAGCLPRLVRGQRPVAGETPQHARPAPSAAARTSHKTSKSWPVSDGRLSVQTPLGDSVQPSCPASASPFSSQPASTAATEAVVPAGCRSSTSQLSQAPDGPATAGTPGPRGRPGPAGGRSPTGHRRPGRGPARRRRPKTPAKVAPARPSPGAPPPAAASRRRIEASSSPSTRMRGRSRSGQTCSLGRSCRTATRTPSSSP